MPKDISGAPPISKSQKNKWRKRKPVQTHGGVCSRCGQTSNSATVGSVHEGCGEATELFSFLYRNRAAVLNGHFIGNKGKWLSQHQHSVLQQEMQDAKDAHLKYLRNFNTATGRWENGYGEPIDFKTREVLPEEKVPECSAPERSASIKISVEMDVEPEAVTERAAEQVAA